MTTRLSAQAITFARYVGVWGDTLDGGVYEQSGSDMFVRSPEERAEDARRMLEAPECEETKGRVERPCART